MKKEEKYIMKIETAPKPRNAIELTLKVLKFVCRHALTLAMFAIIVHGIFKGGTPIIGKTLLFFIGAASIDWLKVKFFKWVRKQDKRSTQLYRNHSSSTTSFTQANYWNSDVVGTSAYLSNLGNRH